MNETWEKNKNDWKPKIDKLIEFSKKELNTSIGNLAIAWILKHKNVSTVLLGASKEEQLIENLQSLNIAKQLTKEHINYIESILNNKPEQPLFWGRILDRQITDLLY